MTDALLAYSVTGEPGTPALVLLHGGGRDKSSWDPVLPALAADHLVYALDLRGFGESSRPGEYSFELMRDDVVAFIDALALDRIVLIGHSMGGNVAYLVAQAYPERLTHLVIEDTAPNRPGDPMTTMFARPTDDELPYDYDALAAVMDQLNHPDPAWWDRMGAITVPTLIIGGGPSSHVDQDRLAELADLLPDARLETIPVGHQVHANAPVEFVALVSALVGP